MCQQVERLSLVALMGAIVMTWHLSFILVSLNIVADGPTPAHVSSVSPYTVQSLEGQGGRMGATGPAPQCAPPLAIGPAGDARASDRLSRSSETPRRSAGRSLATEANSRGAVPAIRRPIHPHCARLAVLAVHPDGQDEPARDCWHHRDSEHQHRDNHDPALPSPVDHDQSGRVDRHGFSRAARASQVGEPHRETARQPAPPAAAPAPRRAARPCSNQG